MQRSLNVGSLDALLALVRGVAKAIRGFAFLVALAVAVIAAALAREGLDTAEVVVVIALLASPAMLLFFSGAVAQLVRLPERLRRMPNQGADQIAELTRIAGDARRAGFRRTPSLLWRLRGVVGSSRDLVGLALPLRAFTPGFLGLTAMAALVGLILLGVGFIALIVLALG